MEVHLEVERLRARVAALETERAATYRAIRRKAPVLDEAGALPTLVRFAIWSESGLANKRVSERPYVRLVENELLDASGKLRKLRLHYARLKVARDRCLSRAIKAEAALLRAQEGAAVRDPDEVAAHGDARASGLAANRARMERRRRGANHPDRVARRAEMRASMEEAAADPEYVAEMERENAVWDCTAGDGLTEYEVRGDE
jgi:hypothetical protein